MFSAVDFIRKDDGDQLCDTGEQQVCVKRLIILGFPASYA